ncbi:hypothetical protein LCGC14_1487830 [marine sediment metagenome]|uniref:Uncharacterized protein n=1 Tax=marine sediment metagenome TaxID=412755 RepID=A0A0F9LNA1_9ZZZZ
MKQQKVSQGVVITGLLCITALLMFALALGYNGTLLALGVGVLAAAIGVAIPNPFRR